MDIKATVEKAVKKLMDNPALLKKFEKALWQINDKTAASMDAAVMFKFYG